MDTQKRVNQRLQKIALKNQEVSLADDIQRLLSYAKGIENFGKNIDVSLDLIEKTFRALKVDSQSLKTDLDRVNKGLELAEKMAKDLGVNVGQVPNYNEAKQSLSYAEKQINKAKKYI